MRGASYEGLPPTPIEYRRRVSPGMRSAVAPSDDVIARRETPCTADPLPCAAAAASSLPQISARSSLISSTDSSTSQSSSSACGTSSVNRHGRPARKSSAAARFVITAMCGRLSARYCNATKCRWIEIPSMPKPCAPCRMAGLQGFEYGVPIGMEEAPGSTSSPCSQP